MLKHTTPEKCSQLNIAFDFSDVDDAEIFEHDETHASSLRDGRFDSGHGFHDQKFSGSDDPAVRWPGILYFSFRFKHYNNTRSVSQTF